MTITLIEQHEYDYLLDIQKRFPALTFQNNGYEYIDKSKLTEEELKAFKDVEDFLRKRIKGFSKFFNFNHNKKGELVLRFDYAYDERFIGVGYLEVQELLK
jgi:hypothetical protein